MANLLYTYFQLGNDFKDFIVFRYMVSVNERLIILKKKSKLTN